MLDILTKRRWHIIILTLLTLAMVLPGLTGLPVIDRDEARFAQASVQMADTGDLLNIRLQDKARNKKPAAAYWAQTAMIKTFVRGGENQIWVQRLPSVMAALLTILTLYWGGLRMVGRKAAMIGCALLAVSLIFVFEGHIAKTDALLCASTTLIFASLGRLRSGETGTNIWIFWIALGFSIMIKGLIGPLLTVSSLLSLLIWERNISWARPLVNWPAILLFVLIWLPWGIAMYVETDGAFYIESLGKDFGGKVAAGQEGHGAPPGSHSLAIWATFWPASLFLLPSLAYAIASTRSDSDNPISRTMRFSLCWAVPFWILIEIMPTKLPHYGLPIFPALSLIIGTGILAMSQLNEFAKTRFFSGVFFLLGTALILGAIIFAQSAYGELSKDLATYVICGLSGGLSVIASFALWGNKIRLSFCTAIMASVTVMIGTYSYILPNLTDLKSSERLATEINRFAPNIESGAIHSPHYTEPSLIYYVGTDINFKAGEIDLADGRLAVLNALRNDAELLNQKLETTAKRRGRCIEKSSPVNGFNYSKGIPLSLYVLREAPC